MESFDKDTQAAVEYITEDKNKKKINTAFRSTRLAALNILKSILIKEPTEIITFVKAQSKLVKKEKVKQETKKEGSEPEIKKGDNEPEKETIEKVK
jgi:hypothetical protein